MPQRAEMSRNQDDPLKTKHGCDVQDQSQDSTTKVHKINSMAGGYTQGLQDSPDQDCVYGQSGPKVGVRPAPR